LKPVTPEIVSPILIAKAAVLKGNADNEKQLKEKVLFGYVYV
jgi:hypothetical protein